MNKPRSNAPISPCNPQNFSTPEKRKLMRQHSKDFLEWCARQENFVQTTGLLWSDFPEPLPTYPEEIRGMMCGAQNRNKAPCKQRVLYTNGRCKFHGGASTGPKTRKGKAKSAKNGFKSKAKQTP